MTTFSQLVDEIVSECKRPDLLSEICSYVNQTIREMHNHPDNNAICQFPENRVELQLTANLDSGFVWVDPEPQIFQEIETVRYDSILDPNGKAVYPKPLNPGRALRDEIYYYYRAADYVSFAGYGGRDSIISLSFFRFPRRLKYAASGFRPAIFDDETGWTYAPAIITDEEKEVARAAVTNWILFRWHDVVAEGARAKTYKRVGDDSRSRTCYSLYGQLRMGMATAALSRTGNH